MERLRKILNGMFGRFSSSKEESNSEPPISQEEEPEKHHPRYLLRMRIENALRERTQLPESPPPTTKRVAQPVRSKPLAKEPIIEEPPLREIPDELVFMCPPMKQMVLGRALLSSKLRRKLVRRPQLMSLVTQDGLRGMGLTTLAAYIYYYDGDKFFPDGKYWLDLSGGNAKSALRRLLHELKVDSKQMRNNLATLSRLLHEQLAEQRVLLVLNHAEAISPKNSAEVLRQIEQIRLPSPAITLVTSTFSLYPKQEIQVERFNETNGFAFFRKKLEWKRKEEQQEKDNAIRLIEHLGGLPLALELTTRRMRQHTPPQTCELALAELEREMQDETKQAQVLQLPFRKKGEQYVAQSFLLSYNMLSDEVKYVFHALGICAPSGVSVVALAHIIDKSPNEVDLWLVELVSYSLTHYDRTVGRTQLHGLLHDYAVLLAQTNHEQYEEMRIRHQQYFKEEIAGSYEQALKDQEGEESLLALKRIDAEADNVRLAQQRAFTK